MEENEPGLFAVQEDAKRRILQDLSEIKEKLGWEHVAIQHAKDNIFSWHVNLQPRHGALKDTLFHLVITFKQTYPDEPPQVEIKAPLEGPQIVSYLGNTLLELQILKEGWDPARTAVEILEQIDEVLNNYAEQSPEHLEDVKKKTQAYVCKVTGHTYENPIPRPPCIKASTMGRDADGGSKTYVNNPSNEWQVAKATAGVSWGKVMYEAKLDKVEKVLNQYDSRNGFVPAATSNICSCRFGWATDDSKDTAISGIFYGNGDTSHIVVRSKTRINEFTELNENETFKEGDTISTGIDFEEGVAWFARNGEKVGNVVGYALPEYLRNKKLYPVVGLQNSAVQLNFGTPRREVADTEEFMTIDQHKAWSYTDYLWETKKPVLWIELFAKPEPNSKRLKATFNIFSFLTDDELIQNQTVCKTWQARIDESYLLHRAQFRCFFIRTPFTDCTLGLGVNIEYVKENILKVRSNLDYLSYSAWQSRDVRKGPGQNGTTFTHFLPLIIDPNHANRSLQIFEQLLPTYLPDQNVPYNPRGIINVLTALMNGSIVTLSSDSEEPTQQRTKNQLQLYCHLHHLLLFLNESHGHELTKIINADISSITGKEKDVTKLEKEQCFDMGTFMMGIAITQDYEWKNLRRPILLEGFDRDVPKYLARFPELEFPGTTEPASSRLSKVMDCTVYDRRRTMLQVFFTCRVNRASPSPEEQLRAYNQRFGCPAKECVVETLSSLSEIFAVDDWASYFTKLYLKPQNEEFLANVLGESMQRAKNKGYYIPTEPPVPTYAPEPEPAPVYEEPFDDDPYSFQHRVCSSFNELVPPLAACLDGVDPFPLQTEALPRITSGKENIIVSPLGTGKHTLAAITIIHTLLSQKKSSQVLVLVPERNQAIHFEEILDDVYIYVPPSEIRCKKQTVKVVLCNFDTPRKQEMLKYHTVLIGTPRKVINLLSNQEIDIDRLKAVYVLEGDVMLTRFQQQTLDAFSFIREGIPVTMMCSTFSRIVEDQSVRMMSADLYRKTDYSHFKHWFVACINLNKKKPMFDLLCREMKFEQALCFVNSAEQAKQFHDHLVSLNTSGTVGFLQTNVESDARRETVSNFNNQATRILIVDDLSLYGLRTQQVDVLIHIDVPHKKHKNPETPLDIYHRRLANCGISSKDKPIHSICFTWQNAQTENFMNELKEVYGSIEELPSDPNNLPE